MRVLVFSENAVRFEFRARSLESRGPPAERGTFKGGSGNRQTEYGGLFESGWT